MPTEKPILKKYSSKVAVRYTPQKKDFLEAFAGSRGVTEKVEYELVKRGHRKAARLNVTFSEFADYTKKTASDGMVLLPIPLEKAESFLPCAVAREMDDAREMLNANVKGDIMRMGELLGYPDCCNHFFNKIWNSRVHHYLYESALNSEHKIEEDGTVVVCGAPELNPFLHWFGIHLISWSPCNFNCEKALEKSRVWLEVLEKVSLGIFKFFPDILSKQMTWSLNKGIAFIEHPLFYGVAWGEFDPNEKVKVRWEPR